MWVARPPKSNIGSLIRFRTCADASSCCRSLNVPFTHGVAERLDVALLEVRDELGPRVEACLAGDGELGIGKLERSRRRGGIGANRANARERCLFAVTRSANQILRELVLLFEIGGKRDEFGVDTDDLLQYAPVSASWAEERSLVTIATRHDRWALPFPRTGGVLQTPQAA